MPKTIAELEAELEALRKVAEEEASKVDDEEEDEDESKVKKPDDEDEKPLSPEEQAIVDRELKKMKENMNAMSAKLKKKEKEAAAKEAELKADQIRRLKEDGKLQEALEMELKETKDQLEVAIAENTQLNRDGALETVLSALDFRNSRSRAMAKTDITNQLVQVDGVWQHKSGVSIAEAVDEYAQDPENKFLFKSKPNVGGGTLTTSPTPIKSKPTSVLEMDTATILKEAAAGRLGRMKI